MHIGGLGSCMFWKDEVKGLKKEVRCDVKGRNLSLWGKRMLRIRRKERKIEIREKQEKRGRKSDGKKERTKDMYGRRRRREEGKESDGKVIQGVGRAGREL